MTISMQILCSLSVTLPLNSVYYRRPSITDQNVNVPSVRSYPALHYDSSVVVLTALRWRKR